MWQSFPQLPGETLARRRLWRCAELCFEKTERPETYYEWFGLYIPNVIFPTGNIIKDGLLYLYYGVCDTAIALATLPLDELADFVLTSR